MRSRFVNLHDRVRAGSVAIDADEIVDVASVERRIQKTRQVEDVTVGPRSCVGSDDILIGGTDFLEDHSIDAGSTRQRIGARTADEYIVARKTTDDVDTRIAEQGVGRQIPFQRIIGFRADDVGIGRVVDRRYAGGLTGGEVLNALAGRREGHADRVVHRIAIAINELDRHVEAHRPDRRNRTAELAERECNPRDIGVFEAVVSIEGKDTDLLPDFHAADIDRSVRISR